MNNMNNIFYLPYYYYYLNCKWNFFKVTIELCYKLLGYNKYSVIEYRNVWSHVTCHCIAWYWIIMYLGIS